MRTQYYDWDRNVALGSEDGVPLSEWALESHRRPFATHPAGFPIFLAPGVLEKSDEYADGDHYAVEERIDSPFQRRRSDCTRQLLRRALSECPGAQPRILDVACGEGHLSEEIRQEQPGSRVSAFDYSVSAILRATELFPEIDFAVADAYSAPYPPAYFDIVVCNNIWEHVPDPLRMLERIAALLRPGGWVIISTPSRFHIKNLMRAMQGSSVGLINPMHVTEYTVGQVVEQLRWGGFETVEIESRAIKEPATSLKQTLGLRVILPILRAYARAVGSHHRFETTVFYLARKKS